MALPRDSKGRILLVPFLAALFGFTTQLPNPVFFNPTNKFGLQLSVPVTLYVIWRFRKRIPPVVTRAYGLLLVPLFVSMVAGSGAPTDFSALYKFAVFTGISFLPLLAAGFLVDGTAAYFLRGTAWAILVHVAVGVLQVLAGFGKVPFDIFFHLYNNGEYATDQYAIPIMLRSVRPFGLYPEPSAMAACISPFIVLFVAYSIGLIRFPGTFDKGCRRLILTSGILGAIFVVISRSGGSMFLAASIILLFLVRAFQEPPGARRTLLTTVPIAFGACSAAVLVIGRLEGGAASDALNGSWAIRIGSIEQAVKDYLTAPPWIILFGFAGLARVRVGAETNFSGIYSVLLSYIVNGGLVAVACVWRICVDIANSFRKVRLPVVSAAYALTYLSGIGFATSYSTPAPLYTALAVLLMWHRFALPVEASQPTSDPCPPTKQKKKPFYPPLNPQPET